MPNATKEELYDVLTKQASLAEAGGLAKERAILLLWYLRSVMGIDDLEAYEYVCDGDADAGIDGLYLEDSGGDDGFETLVIFQSKYPQTPKHIGRTDLEGLVASPDKFRTPGALKAFLQGGVEHQLRTLISRFDLLARLEAGAYDQRKLRIRLVFTTAGVLTNEARTFVTTVNNANGAGYLTAHDLLALGGIAKAISEPGVPDVTICLPAGEGQRLVLGEAPNRILIAPLKAIDIVGWPGIEDRSLFELNVRRELRMNRVRKQLDAAIRRQDEQCDFLAFHNGLTITCHSFDPSPDNVVVSRPSVVNGAQSVVALFAASLEGAITTDLQILAKIVETAERPNMAEQVSRRSNTQNPVNPRNLVANAPRQRTLVAQFQEQYPDFIYETKPDASLDAPPGKTIIQNDDAAQLLCALFNEQPWLAVKRNSLFEPDNHPRIFNEHIAPPHVLLAHRIATVIDGERDRFPPDYRRSWRLTRLVATYIVGQLLRADDEKIEEVRTITDPAWALSAPDRLDATIQKMARYAAGTLKIHHKNRSDAHGYDDFKVEFKNESALRELRSKAQEFYLIQDAVDAED